MFSISHSVEDARVYGHYAVLEAQGGWTYRRCDIRKFDLGVLNGLLDLHNFVRNALNKPFGSHTRRIINSLQLFPTPEPIFEAASDQRTSDTSVDQDGFAIPSLPRSNLDSATQLQELLEKFDKDKQQQEEARKRQEEILKRQEDELRQLREQVARLQRAKQIAVVSAACSELCLCLV